MPLRPRFPRQKCRGLIEAGQITGDQLAKMTELSPAEMPGPH
ncbi:hypothetical protein RC1_2934 [Rhodospirillum centenum SW]|uniref:Uncharacterized protein n=1 Tax=Rhodospirillum centenum (strain ATCC 51521 / SW) TaxID=414684 RepID=B6IVH8_RHOCS|nr:hypothetical protein RC1_2934 [Rhodospirillum centenum SW]